MRVFGKAFAGPLLLLSVAAWSAEDIHGPPSPAEIDEMANCLALIPDDGWKELNKLKEKLKGIESLAAPSTSDQYLTQASSLIKNAVREMTFRSQVSVYAHYRMEADGLGDKIREDQFPVTDPVFPTPRITSDYCKLAHIELSANHKILEETLEKAIAERVGQLKSGNEKSALAAPQFWATANWPLYGTPSVDAKHAEDLKYILDFYEKQYGIGRSEKDLEARYPAIKKPKGYNSLYSYGSVPAPYASRALPAELNLSERVAIQMMLEHPKIEGALAQPDLFPRLAPYREIVLKGLKKLPPFVGPLNYGVLLDEDSLQKYQPGEVVEFEKLTPGLPQQWGNDSLHHFRIFSKTSRQPRPGAPAYILPGSKFKVLFREKKPDGTIHFVLEEQSL